MRKKTLISSIVVLFVSAATVTLNSQTPLAPRPQNATQFLEKQFSGSHAHCSTPDFSNQAKVFVEALQRMGVDDATLSSSELGEPSITFIKDSSIPFEGYSIHSKDDVLRVKASSPQGLAYSISSLLQLVVVEDGEAHWPQVSIEDQPDVAYRSFMIDMGRNPHPPKILRHVVDMMWFSKANYLHLHLTDDQLFSWPSTAYPNLSSDRAGWNIDDFQALEAYSQARGVTIVPEIDVPGHSTILRREYPEIFGKTTTVLANSSTAQQGIETLITEFLSVFKATPYVHIGGDEAGGVSAEDQRDFINRLNQFVRSQGKRTIVWEGPHLGKGANKIAEDVIHMNWRTINFPAQQMLDAGYKVINAAWDPLYIVDHYPRTMFTAVEVKRCYEWNPQRFAHINHEIPTFETPHMTDTAEGIIGYCMPWWEGRAENLLPLCLPRFMAVSSAAWNRSGENDFNEFQQRCSRSLARLESISGFALPALPFARENSQWLNRAYKGKVTPSQGASQPHFGPDRLTNGITDQFDHFLGFPTQPSPLEILIELVSPAELSRIVIYERAVGKSYEVYDLFASSDGIAFEKIGSAGKGSRGEINYVEHTFPKKRIHTIKIATQGCHGLTFPSFSRLTEVMAFEN